MLFNQDFKDMLFALSEANAEFLLVGAYALAVHGYPRATGDLDIWVRADSKNAPRVFQSLAAFGAPLDDLTIEDLSKPGIVFQIGVEPSRIDILTAISGVDFSRAWDRRVSIEMDGVCINVLGREDFIVNKRASGRPKDLVDADTLDPKST
ncbi:nucleotidyltransferase [Pirellulaceae bacterium SH501]